MKTEPHRLLLAAALVAAVSLAACGRKETAPAPAPAAPASAPAAAAPAAPAGPIIPPMQVAAATEAQRSAGATLAAQGAGSAAACNGCHGAQGEGMAATGFPRIAGQSRSYLQHELESYASGARKHPVMQPIAAAMSPEQRAAAAVYFASLSPDGTPVAGAATPAASGASGPTPTVAAAPAAAPSAPAAAKASSGRGSLLANVGDNAKGIQACANCHGPGGMGSGELYPYLAGQHAGYLSATLGAWRDGSRANDPSGQMPVIANLLSPEDVAAVSAYYAAQMPRATPVGGERMALPAGATGPAVVSGPQAQQAGAGAAAAGGASTEQGAATTGGAQGPGGGGGTGPASTGNPQAGVTAGAAGGTGAAAPASSAR
jgi:cytochrome c553